MAFVVAKTVDFTKLARTNAANATPESQLLTTGLYDKFGGFYSTEGGCVLTVPVSVGGAYTVAPTLTGSATGQGSGSSPSGKATFTCTATLGGGTITGVAMTATGRDYIKNPPVPTISGGTGTGLVLGTPTISKTDGAGTVGCTNGSAAVVGSGTTFLTDVVAGEDILINQNIYNILSITDDTNLTLTTNFGQSTASGLAYSYGGNIFGGFQNLNSIAGFTNAFLGYLLNASGVTTQDQKQDLEYIWSASTNVPSMVFRYNGSIGTYGAAITVGISNSHAAQIAYFDGVSASTLRLNSGAPSPLHIVGHKYRATVSAINAGSSTCTVSITITDLTAGGDIFSGSTTFDTGTTYANVASAGRMGIGNGNVTNTITKLVQYNTQGIIISPSSVILNQTGVTLNLSDVSADWVSNPPTFVASGTNASVTAQNVLTATTATVTISTGTFAGAIIITDTVGADSGQTNSVAMNVPAAIIAQSSVTSIGATIAASAFPTNGNPNYTAKVYRSPNSNFVYNDGSATLISTQTGIGASTVPTSVVDTSASPGVNFYVWVITDSTGQIVQGAQTGADVYVASSLRAGFIGDSITNGHAATALIQWCNTVGIVTRGSGQTPGTYDLIFTGGLGSGAAGKIIIGSDGLARYGYLTSPGYGYTSETTSLPTVTFTGGGGTPATLTMNNGTAVVYGPAGNIGGGYPLECLKILQMDYGFKNLRMINCGQNGTATSSWLPHGATRITGATNASPIVITSANAHGMTTGQQYQINTVSGNTAANGTWYVNALTSSTASLWQDSGLTIPVVGNGVYTASTGIVVGVAPATPGWNLEAAMSSFGGSSATPYVSIMLGANDANGITPLSTYQQNLMGIVYTLTQNGYKVVLNYPMYWTTGGADVNRQLQIYASGCDAVAADFPGVCQIGMTQTYGMFLNSPELLADGLHPNDAGYGVLGGNEAAILAPLLGLVSPSGGTGGARGSLWF